MGHFLRDQQIQNVTVDADLIRRIYDALEQRQQSMPEFDPAVAATDPTTFLIATIRFDEKGYRVFVPDALLNHFSSAKCVERIIFELVSGTALGSNRNTGSFADLRLDSDLNTRCFLTVSSDSEDWVNSTFAAVYDVLKQGKNRNYIIRNAWVDFLVQVFGLLLGFAVSLWGSSIIAPQLKIENAFLISFFLVLLLFSNLWVPIKMRGLAAINRLYPPIRFYRREKDTLHWLGQAIVGGIVLAITLYGLGSIFTWAGKVLGRFINLP